MLKTKQNNSIFQNLNLFHLTKRTDLPTWKAILIRGSSILAGIFSACIILLIFCQANPFLVIKELFAGNFASERRFGSLLKEMFLLLGVGLALIPAFKMKFWNLGGNGQILMGCLASILCMKFMGEANCNDTLIHICMIITSILAGVIWAVIPAIFKAFFNTNESLFTLMLNYVAVIIVKIVLSIIVKSGSGTLGIVETGWLSVIGNKKLYLLVVIVVSFIWIGVSAYLKSTKEGYELTVVGESQNTAKYIGINVKFVIIRTLVISGMICGIIGMLLAGSINHTITEQSANNMGFTAIMVAWLAKFNPILMILTSFLVTFISNGMSNVQSVFGISSDAIKNIVIGIVYFFIIGSEFFISYKIIFNKKKKEEVLETNNPINLETEQTSTEETNKTEESNLVEDNNLTEEDKKTEEIVNEDIKEDNIQLDPSSKEEK